MSDVRMTVWRGFTRTNRSAAAFVSAYHAQRIRGLHFIVMAPSSIEDQVGREQDKRHLGTKLREGGASPRRSSGGRARIRVAGGAAGEGGAVDHEAGRSAANLRRTPVVSVRSSWSRVRARTRP